MRKPNVRFDPKGIAIDADDEATELFWVLPGDENCEEAHDDNHASGDAECRQDYVLRNGERTTCIAASTAGDARDRPDSVRCGARARCPQGEIEVEGG